MADGSNLILGSEGNSANNRTSVTKNQGFLPVLDLFNDHGVGLLIIAGESIVHGGEASQGEALAAFSPGTAVVGTGDQSGVFGSGAETGVDAVCNAGVAVRGVSQTGVGVRGQSSSGPGVHAQSSAGVGVYATSAGRPAVIASSLRGIGAFGTSNGSHGTVGFARGAGNGGDRSQQERLWRRILRPRQSVRRSDGHWWQQVGRRASRGWVVPAALCAGVTRILVRGFWPRGVEAREDDGPAPSRFRGCDRSQGRAHLSLAGGRLQRAVHQRPEQQGVHRPRATGWHEQRGLQLSRRGKAQGHSR